jgi:hypothetical protein
MTPVANCDLRIRLAAIDLFFQLPGCKQILVVNCENYISRFDSSLVCGPPWGYTRKRDTIVPDIGIFVRPCSN